MEWHDPLILVPSFLAWNGFFFATLKWFGSRMVKSMDERLETITEIDRRLIHVETSLKSRPQCSQHAEHMLNVKALHSRLDTISSKVDKVSGHLEGVGRAVDLMNQFLIEQGGKK